MTETTKPIFQRSYKVKRLLASLRRFTPKNFTNKLALFLILAAVFFGIATYAALTTALPFGDDPRTAIWLLNIDLIILLMLVTLIARRMVGVWSGRKKGQAGSKLHTRLVFIFSLLTVAPAIIMTIFTAFFLHFGVQSWFSERVSTAVYEAQAVAEAYLKEHTQVIKADALAMATDLNREAEFLIENPPAFGQLMKTQSFLRNFSEAVVFDREGNVIAKAGLTLSLALESIDPEIMNKIGDGDVVVMTNDNDDRVRALLKLHSFDNGYLFVGRQVDQTVLSHLADTRKASNEYKLLEQERSALQVKVTLIFIIVALLLLFAAIWFGLIFSRQLVQPIGSLISAADRVRGGDLTARVPETKSQDEFEILAKAFNRMTIQIQEQRSELVSTNRQLDDRRRFTEAVLAGVSSGVIGVDKDDRVTLANAAALKIFGEKDSELVGRRITKILPDLKESLEDAKSKPGKIVQTELPYNKDDGFRRVLLIRIANEGDENYDRNIVLTFDDITELQSAQRKAAWADVARRIAHEIKNPLTPIQLSAERLKRKYMSQISEDQDIFSQCTDTIINHVGDIGRMVNEFSAFARMPEPNMKYDNLKMHLRDTLSLQQQAHSKLKINFTDGRSNADDPLFTRFDAQQIRQAFTNIIQNAIDSLEASNSKKKGRVEVLLTLSDDEDTIFITVTDNGPGFPKDEDRARLTEPYITHKEKGTGLGLAIVKKIMEDHAGQLILGGYDGLQENEYWEDLGGATVSMVLSHIDASEVTEKKKVS